MEFHCISCNKIYKTPILICPDCNVLLKFIPNNKPSNNLIWQDSMWMFEEFFPLFNTHISFKEGSTPVLSIKNITDLQGLHLKLESRNPTGSFRDRASSLIVSHAKEIGQTHIINASTGSFSVSLAAYCANAKIDCTSIIPQNLDLAKIEQLELYKSKIIKTGDSLDDAISLAKKETERDNAYSPIPTENILTIEGQKSIGLEFAHQLPLISDVIIPLGSGSLVLSVHRGFQTAFEQGWLPKIPRIHAVELKDTGSSRLVESLEHQETELLTMAMDIIEKNNGMIMNIDPNYMVEDAVLLAKNEGIFIEPASASVISAARNLVESNVIQPKSTAALLSGSGLNALNVLASQTRVVKKAVWGVATQSTTKYEILNLIESGKANHGYAIWEIFNRSISQQGLYQHLKELEQKGLIIYDLGERRKKIFKLTQKGQLALQQFRNIIDLI